MGKINHWCVVCGKGYEACDACAEIKTYNPWRTITDTIEHFKIYNILCDYRDGRITKDVAKEQLKHVDISDWENFKEGTRDLIAEILKEDKKKIIKTDLNSDIDNGKNDKT